MNHTTAIPLLLAALGATTPLSAAELSTDAGDFNALAQLPPAAWQLVRFDDKIPATEYRLREHQGVTAVEARADASMALLARPLAADLEQTPVLCWRWWVDQPVAEADLNTKAGDDYAARIYVTFDLPDSALSLGTRLKLKLARSVHGGELPDAAINYVWDNRHPVGTAQANAYTDRAQMLVLRSGQADSGHWVEERRNLLDDLQQLFGADAAQPLQLAIASDGDNTGAQTGAYFADLQLVAADAPCQFPPALTTSVATSSEGRQTDEH